MADGSKIPIFISIWTRVQIPDPCKNFPGVVAHICVSNIEEREVVRQIAGAPSQTS